MPFDPHSAFEAARLLFSGISAVGAAIGIWRGRRNQEEASKAFDEALAKTRDSAEAEQAAAELVNVMPEDVLKMMESRAELCWVGYKTVVDGKFLPDEIDRATDAVRACVCRELRRIYKLNGQIPPRWIPQWEKYGCTA